MNELHESLTDAAPRLLRTPPPYADESLPGYLIRLTEANHYAFPQWWLPLAGFPKDLLAGWQRLHSGRLQFDRWAALTGQPAAEFQAWNQATQTDAPLRTRYAQVCPRCLAEQNYCRQWWDELVVTVCPRHHVVLLDRCPACRQRMRWQRGRVSGCKCGADWRQAPTTGLAATERRSLRWLGLDDTPNVLSWSARSVALFKLAQYCGSERRGWSLQTEHEVATLRLPFEHAAAVLLDGKEACLAFCQQLERHGQLERGAEDLRLLANSPELAFLRLSLEKVLAQWAQEPTRDSYPSLAERFITPAEACRRLSFSARQWRQFLPQSDLTLHPDPWATAQQWVDVRELEHVVERREHLFTVESAAHEWGLPLSDTVRLIESGYLQVVSGPEIDGFPDRRIATSDIFGLYHRLEKSAEVSRHLIGELIEGRRIMSLQQVYQQLNQHGLQLSDWLSAVIRGEIQPVKAAEPLAFGGCRLTQFCYRCADLAAYLQRCGVVLPSPPSPLPPPAPKPLNWPVLTHWLQGQREQESRRFTRRGIASYDLKTLPLAARRWPTNPP